MTVAHATESLTSHASISVLVISPTFCRIRAARKFAATSPRAHAGTEKTRVCVSRSCTIPARVIPTMRMTPRSNVRVSTLTTGRREERHESKWRGADIQSFVVDARGDSSRLGRLARLIASSMRRYATRKKIKRYATY